MLRVTQLEPRTLHQPEKLKKLSKNDPVVLLLISESTKRVLFYPVYFQADAGRPQAGDRILCSDGGDFAQRAGGARVFAIPDRNGAAIGGFRGLSGIVKIRRKPCWAGDLVGGG
jgi:hypothetical protein